MPEISLFFGIVIAMYYNDHAPAHFHCRYGDYLAKIDIQTGAMLDGALPRRALSLVQERRNLHQSELLTVWQRILDRQPHAKIDPLE